MDPIKALYPPTPEPSWDLSETAFLMVDLQYFDAHREWGEGKTAQEMGISDQLEPFFNAVDTLVPRVNHFLQVLREKEAEIMHIRVAERTADSRDVGLKQRVRGLFVPSNSKEAEFLPEVAPMGDEMVFSKSASGVFPWTSLDRILQTMGIRHLVLAGVSTGGCIESAVRDAADMGYWVTVLSDGCADSSSEAHQAALDRMTRGRVVTASLGEVLGRLKAADPVQKAPKDWPRKSRDASAETNNPYYRIFGPPVEPRLQPARTALVLLDFQRFCAHPEGGLQQKATALGQNDLLVEYFQRVTPGVARAQQLLDVARVHNVPVIHLRQSECLPDSRDAGANRRDKGFLIPGGDDDGQFLHEMSPLDGEIVLSRSCDGAFTRTGLEQLLRDLQVETVLLAGMNYEGAVEGTLRSATDRGYPVVLVPDACVSSTPLGDQRLRSLESGLTRVLAVGDIRERLERYATS